MKTDFEHQIMEIFGTTDLDKLREIARNAQSSHCTAEESVYPEQHFYEEHYICAKHSTGRKNSFNEQQIAQILALQQQGMKITNIAKQFHVSRQTIYSQIKRAHHFSDDPDVKMRMNFMNRNNLCTTIDIDFKHEKISIQNYTDEIPLRAFGVVTNPDWSDFEYFLEDRCFPRTRDHAKEILREMGLPFYDPLLIIEKTQGRMAGDHQWIMILKKEE